MRPIDADALQDAMKSVTNDPTCPLHIAAEVDQYIDFAPTVGGWIQYSERMPEAGETVLVYTHRRGVTLDFLDVYVSNGKRFFHNSDVTNWMPLPEPPKGGKQ